MNVRITLRDSAAGPDGRSYPTKTELILRRRPPAEMAAVLRRLGYDPADVLREEVAE